MQCGRRNYICYLIIAGICILESDWKKSHWTWSLYISLICVTAHPPAHPQREDVETKIFMAVGLCTLKAKLTLKKSLKLAGKKATQSTWNKVWGPIRQVEFHTLRRNASFDGGGRRQDCACELEPHVSFSGFSLEGGMSEKGCTRADSAGRSRKMNCQTLYLVVELQ